MAKGKTKKAETVTKSEVTPAQAPILDTKTDIPEELESVWDPAIAVAFKALLPKQQDFILQYIQTWNAAEAYRRSHNHLAKDTVASANGSRLVANDSIGVILAKFANNKTEALFLVQKTYNDAAQLASKPIFGKDDLGQPILVMEQPDYAVRVKAAEAIAKLHGLNQPAEVKHSGEITSKVIQVNLPTKKPVA
ncbi:MAG: terminase small subunit [Fibrobacterota bacterium]|nr:terminase small subunit [Fibrobacterota bacterium]